MTAPVESPLLDLAHVRLREMRADRRTLDVIMRRLFDPRERELLTVSAFQSAL